MPIAEDYANRRHNQNQRFYACINMETPPRPQSNIPVTNEPSQAGPIVRASVSPSKKKLGAALTSMDEFNDALRERTAVSLTIVLFENQNE